ncbi:MAG: hypothetical protein ACPGUV_09785, partial [Polyangiales bacterium]
MDCLQFRSLDLYLSPACRLLCLAWIVWSLSALPLQAQPPPDTKDADEAPTEPVPGETGADADAASGESDDANDAAASDRGDVPGQADSASVAPAPVSSEADTSPAGEAPALPAEAVAPTPGPAAGADAPGRVAPAAEPSGEGADVPASSDANEVASTAEAQPGPRQRRVPFAIDHEGLHLADSRNVKLTVGLSLQTRLSHTHDRADDTDRVGTGVRRIRLLFRANLGRWVHGFVQLAGDNANPRFLDADFAFLFNDHISLHLGRFGGAQPAAFVPTVHQRIDGIDRAVTGREWARRTVGPDGRDYAAELRVLYPVWDLRLQWHNGDGNWDRLR